ncbi:hypothetical protein [Burkholderia ubonensis]|uniref:hypothetical protein n=1 Tax=Burkholderia ubonensis TaxID=101571 RepID=UPI0012FB1A39|nr:hypothetical protein [Burkholderia ubonensis]
MFEISLQGFGGQGSGHFIIGFHQFFWAYSPALHSGIASAQKLNRLAGHIDIAEHSSLPNGLSTTINNTTRAVINDGFAVDMNDTNPDSQPSPSVRTRRTVGDLTSLASDHERRSLGP